MKETVIEVNGKPYNKNEILSLLNLVEALRSSGVEMGKEITSLKHKIGGYKTSNAAYKNINENMRAFIKECEKKDIKIKEQSQELEKKRELLEQVIKERNEAVKKYLYIRNLPWYKRIFAKL